MSISLNDLLEWHDRLLEQSGEEAHMLRALIARREKELRTHIADMIALASQRENWKLQRCAAIARRVEQAPVQHLESIHKFFLDRDEGKQQVRVPAILSDFFAEHRQEADVPRIPVQTPPTATIRASIPVPIANLYGVMHMLESRVAATPGIACGIQGIRLMRMVALMSKARSAQIAKMRMSGTQAIYRHS
ncbi:hypothetical protein NOV72_05727 [Caballeronia novacaledonica]|uniref:Uncharacterized protein n=1 Tax=Caballeronia novacaledonica TaxID=1544861 RepID=A0A2U3IE82_9BURK|nr:hypothetical protein [Caballeronia novacaledonica]SPB18528.1 hypothetical protein NOV72_05727 [Caballeronia novacaledonica]